MKLNEIFTRSVVTVGPKETLAAVALQMQEHNVGTVVIVEDRRPVGIVTDRDLALALGAQGVSSQVAVQKVMTRHVLAIPDDTSIYTATKFMREEGLPLGLLAGDGRGKSSGFCGSRPKLTHEQGVRHAGHSDRPSPN